MSAKFHESPLAAAIRTLATQCALYGYSLGEVTINRTLTFSAYELAQDPIHYTRSVMTTCGAVRVRVPA